MMNGGVGGEKRRRIGRSSDALKLNGGERELTKLRSAAIRSVVEARRRIISAMDAKDDKSDDEEGDNQCNRVS